MHGSASALVGIAIGRFRYGHGAGRLLSALLGWVVAIGLHMGFNRLVNAGPSVGAVLGTLGLGVGGVVLIVVFIRWGLAEEKRWIAETLGIGSGVTRGEVAVVRQYDRIDELLEPIVERFGEEKAEQVEEFLLKQAQLGIKRKAQTMSQDPAEQKGLGKQIATLHEEMEAIRRKVGVYCMTLRADHLPRGCGGVVDHAGAESVTRAGAAGLGRAVAPGIACRPTPTNSGRRTTCGLGWESRGSRPSGNFLTGFLVCYMEIMTGKR